MISFLVLDERSIASSDVVTTVTADDIARLGVATVPTVLGGDVEGIGRREKAVGGPWG